MSHAPVNPIPCCLGKLTSSRVVIVSKVAPIPNLQILPIPIKECVY